MTDTKITIQADVPMPIVQDSKSTNNNKKIHGDKVENNGAFWVRISVLCSLLFNALITAITFSQVALRGKDNSDLASQYSPTLFVFSFITLGAALLSIYDVKKTFEGTKLKTEVLTWKWQHSLFKRCCLSFAVHALLALPITFTFVFQSIGTNFFDLLDQINSDYYKLLVLLMISFALVIVTGAFSFLLTKYTIDHGKFAKDNATKDDIILPAMSSFWGLSTKILSLVSSGSSVWFAVELVDGAQRDTNSGVILFTTIYIMMCVMICFYNISLLFQSHRPKKWWLAFRAVSAVHLFVAYFVFWLCLLLISLLGSGKLGFWSTINGLTVKRRGLIYAHLSFFVSYLVVTAFRIYMCKLRSADRQPRIFEPLASSTSSKLLLNKGKKGKRGRKDASSNDSNQQQTQQQQQQRQQQQQQQRQQQQQQQQRQQ